MGEMLIKKLLISLSLLAATVLPVFSPAAYSALSLMDRVELSMYTEEYGVLVHRGLDVHITVGEREGYDEIVVIAKAWIRPIGADWEKFKINYYHPRKALWELDLLDFVKDTFDLWMVNLEVIEQGIDDSMQEVYVITRFYLRDSFSFYVSHTTVGISIVDRLKQRGKGWIDEVRVRSDLDVHFWTPEPTSQSNNEAVWINPSMETAPDYYLLEIEPICIIMVIIECLPSNHLVNILVNGKSAGMLRGGDWHIFASPSELSFVEIAPEEFSEGLIRYRAASRMYLGSCPGVAMFKFEADYTGMILAFVLVLCTVTAIASWVSYRALKRARGVREDASLAVEREKLKRELERLEGMVKEYREIIGKLEKMIKEYGEHTQELKQLREESETLEEARQD